MTTKELLDKADRIGKELKEWARIFTMLCWLIGIAGVMVLIATGPWWFVHKMIGSWN